MRIELTQSSWEQGRARKGRMASLCVCVCLPSMQKVLYLMRLVVDFILSLLNCWYFQNQLISWIFIALTKNVIIQTGPLCCEWLVVELRVPQDISCWRGKRTMMRCRTFLFSLFYFSALSSRYPNNLKSSIAIWCTNLQCLGLSPY